MNFNFVVNNWFVHDNLNVNNLYGLISENLCHLSPPGVIIFQVGRNLVGHVKTQSLIWSLKHVFYDIHTLLPNTILLFSEIIPELAWSKNLKFKDRIRKRLNRCLHKFLCSIGFRAYRHIDLEDWIPGFYTEDDFNLSPIGLDVFIVGLQNMVEIGLRLLRVSCQ